MPSTLNNCNNNQLTFSCAKLATSTAISESTQLEKNNIKIYAQMSSTSYFSPSPTLPPSKSLLTLIYCSFVIILTSSSTPLPFIALANCDQLLPALAPPPLASITPTLGNPSDQVQRRFARSAIYANRDYPSLLATNKGGYLAANGLRTKYKPQQFFPVQTNLPLAADTVSDLASLNLITGAREDICKGHCTCTRQRSAFLHVDCNFEKNWKLSENFGTNLKVPSNASSITIRLAPKTKFSLERGFFNDNRVNSFTIEGVYSESEQVEITTESFNGNNGPYPDIIMLNVFTVIVRAKAFLGGGKFTVRNSNLLILYPDAFEKAQINGNFVRINDLRIEEKAFNSAQAKLRIESSNIDNIYRFEASLHEIRYINCTIGTINGGTFDVININSIVFEDCRINAIKAKAITEKLYSKHVSITGAIIGSIESEAIYGSGISELILTNNKIDTIQDNAIYVTAINATIAHNNIKHLGTDWLRVKQWSNIVVEKNKFGVFGRMLLEPTNQPVTCRFDGNSITRPLPGSLNITNPYCILREISLNIPCSCKLDWLDELSSHDLRSETYCTIDEKLSHCFNATSFNTLKYLNEVCDESKTTLDCVATMNLKKLKGRFFTPEELDQQRMPELIYIVAGSILLVLLVVLVVIVACRYRSRSQSDGSSSQSSNINAIPHISNHLHEFSVEDRHVIDQTMKLMQKRYPEIYKQINERTQLLLQRDLPDKKCVKAISQIVNLLNKVDSAGDDFVTFNRVLTQHLQPQLPTAPPADPIYSEPGLTGLDGLYTTSAIMPLPDEGYCGPQQSDDATGGQSNPPEHIYAEPNCAQQPLLRNEYASPADRNLDSMDLYTEPINERDGPINLMPSTNNQQRLPAYATPIRSGKLPSLPSILPHKGTPTRPQNLPDVLYQSHNNSPTPSPTSSSSTNNNNAKPITNVKKLAQDLQNMPKFHINQLTPSNSQRLRNLHLVAPPVYTAPDLSRKQQPALQPKLASPEADECEYDMRGAAALAPDSGSDHSGGSDETVKMDDVILYADA